MKPAIKITHYGDYRVKFGNVTTILMKNLNYRYLIQYARSIMRINELRRLIDEEELRMREYFFKMNRE